MSKGYTAQSLKQTLYKLGKGYSKIAQAIAQTRWVYNFNGVDNHIDTGLKIVDVDNLSGFSISGWFDYGDGTFFSQNTSSTRANREFHIYELSGFVYIVVRGAISALLTSAETPTVGGLFRFDFTASQCLIYFDGALIKTANYTKGTAPLETGARLIIGGMNFDNVNVTQLKSGVIRDVKINDGSVYNYPINDRTFGTGAVIANTGTGPDATGVNLLESGWTEINL